MLRAGVQYVLLFFSNGSIIPTGFRSYTLLLYLPVLVRCYEVKIEESEKAGSCQESNPGHNPFISSVRQDALSI